MNAVSLFCYDELQESLHSLYGPYYLNFYILAQFSQICDNFTFWS